MDSHSLDDLASFDSVGAFSADDHKLALHNLPSSPPRHRPASPFYNPLGLTIGQISPAAGSFASDRSSYNVSRSNESLGNFLVNAVHMHVQENAKIPNYNKAVDRSNSSSKNHHSRGFNTSDFFSHITQDAHQNNDTLFHPSEDFSMAELFLSKESSHRKSLNQNYEHLGSLIGSTSGGAMSGTQTTKTTTTSADDLDETTAMEIDALTEAIDPTPWSEIEDKMHKEAQRQQQQEQKDHRSAQQHLNAAHHPHQSSYYPYGRHHQLPIPERIQSPPQQHRSIQQAAPSSTTHNSDDHGMAQAVATAAAIAAVSDNNVVNIIDRRRFPASTKPLGTLNTAAPANPFKSRSDQSSSTIPHEEHSEMAPPTSYKPAVDSKNGSGSNSRVKQDKSTIAVPAHPTIRPQHFQRQRANSATPPTHAAAHSTNRASVLAAASRKSQYGFGGNHVVPSVPAPPPNQLPRPKVISTPAPPTDTLSKHGSSTKASHGGIATNSTTKTSLHIPTLSNHGSNLPQSLPNGNPQTNHPEAAYERKKQKAKDARIKLNESIDNLSIAISLAGSQSTERINQLQNHIINTSNACRQRSIQSNQECLNFAEQAKKWDRPSFVGTAAGLIQALNGQCEALMAELVAMQDHTGKKRNAVLADNHTQDVVDNSQDEASDALTGPPLSSTSNSESNKRDVDTIPPGNGQSASLDAELSPEPLNKRARVNDDNEANAKPVSLTTDPVSGKPLSDEAIIFGGVSRYLDPLSMCRSHCVSKTWKDLGCFCDDDTWLNLLVSRFGFFNVRQWRGGFSEGEEGGENEITSKQLYREMHIANVMPQFNQQEGKLSMLGEATIRGKVSAWVFLVERSNGETLRSVKRQPGTPEIGRNYQSRPVVELKVVVQNIGMPGTPVILKDQTLTVDISTRRTRGEFTEISWDDRFRKAVRKLDGTTYQAQPHDDSSASGEISRLSLFDSVVIDVHLLADGCSTTTKFRRRSNFATILVTLDSTTVPMVVPFHREQDRQAN